jgi:biopolymer transport protein ExbB
LLLTFEGVALSVPAIYFHALFRNRVSTISADTMVQADRILRQISRAARIADPMQAVPVAKPAGPPPVPVPVQPTSRTPGASVNRTQA